MLKTNNLGLEIYLQSLSCNQSIHLLPELTMPLVHPGAGWNSLEQVEQLGIEIEELYRFTLIIYVSSV